MSSFRDLFTRYQYVVIPDYQRDYAQGREDKKAKQILNNFLHDIFSFLSGTNESFNLDFVYGNEEISKDVKILYPLDGQQRLTTLLLLHIFLLPQNRKSFLSYNKKSRFSYELRPYSKEFCDFIISDEMNKLLEFRKNNVSQTSLSVYIKNHSRFRTIWEKDVTVMGMLRALDRIEKFYRRSSNLNIERLDRIQFEVLDPKENKFQSDIFLKMNSRGLPLTEFERFKVKIEEYIVKNPIEFQNEAINHGGKNLSIREYFSIKIDNEWADNFCILSEIQDGELYDEKFIVFIKFIYSIYLFKYPEKYIKKSDDDKINPPPLFEFNQLEIYQENISKELIFILINIFDKILKENSIIISDEYKFYYDVLEKFKEIIGKININLSENHNYRIGRVKKNNYLLHLCFYNNIIEGQNDFNKNARLFYNLIENTEFENQYDSDYSSANLQSIINYIISLQKNNSDLYQSFLDNQQNIFSIKQIEEEKVKINLIRFLNNDWGLYIEKYEKHPYFLGRISFLFTFISKNWENISKNDFEKFKIYGEKVFILFDKEGIVKIEDNLIERSLLCFGDYLINPSKKDYYSFLCDRQTTYDFHLRPTWRRFLSWDCNHSEKKRKTIVFKELLDSIESFHDVNIIKESLKLVINDKKNSIIDWRLLFIETPKLFEYFETLRFIQSGRNDDKTIIFLTKDQMLKRIDLYVYYILNKLLESYPNLKFQIEDSDRITIQNGVIEIIKNKSFHSGNFISIKINQEIYSEITIIDIRSFINDIKYFSEKLKDIIIS